MPLNPRYSTLLATLFFGSSLSFGCGSDDLDKPAAGGASSGGATASGGSSGAGMSNGSSTGGRSASGGAGSTARGGAAGSNTGGSSTSGGSGGKSSTSGGSTGVAPGQCDSETPCAEGEICIVQDGETTTGTCYEECTPFKGTCADDGECLSIEVDDSVGFCMPRGTSQAGEECQRSKESTGCAEGLVCGNSQECLSVCSFFGTGPACSGDERCFPYGVCGTVEADAAGVDEACAATAEPGDACGDDGKRIQGLCLSAEADATTTCMAFCPLFGATTNCPSTAHECLQFSSEEPELGVCLDLGECGDGGAEYADCEACVTAETEGTACCAELTTMCREDADCTDLGACVDDCGEQPTEACLESCATDFGAGVELYTAWLSCVFGSTSGFAGSCGAACQSP